VSLVEAARPRAGLDRDTRVAVLVDHARRPRHEGALADADVHVPGGNPGCGDLVTVHVRAALGEERVDAMRFEGSGCTVSQAAASILAELVNRERPSFTELEEFPYERMMELLGPDIVGTRYGCATLALGTLKLAVRSIRTHRKLLAAGWSEEDIRRLKTEVFSS
jgi:nitrogen fixation protein NifU and related proteins